MNTKEFITRFVKNTLGKKTKNGRWSIINWGHMDVLQYMAETSDCEEWEKITKKEPLERIAYRLPDGSVLSNANTLKYVGRKFAWGRETNRQRTQSQEQVWLEEAGAIPIPFTLFEETNTDVRDFSWVVKPKPEKFIEVQISSYNNTKCEITRHFSGACIFAIDKDVYLFDVDRQEIEKHKIFNPFVTKLPSVVNSIQEAYNILIPDEVNEATKNGIEVLRQGEFFFIKHSDDCPVKIDLTDEEKHILKYIPNRIGFNLPSKYTTIDQDQPYTPDELKNIPDTPELKEFQNAAIRYKQVLEKRNNTTSKPGTLGKSATGSHSVEKYIKDNDIVYVSGTVKQNRRQHGDLVLTGWYRVIPNTGVISWTIRGDID